MATVNFSKREILCKIVYYGPGLCGKTTNLQTIHKKVPDKIRGNLTSVATKQDRTLFFDLLPLEVGRVRDFIIRLQLYTVPGQVYYNASRRIVLRGVDGVVFVADSQVGKMEENIESLQNLMDNLIENGVDPSTVPVVLQYNKRDMKPTYSVEELNSAINKNDLSYFEAIASTGQGVFNTLKGISAVVIKDVKDKLDTADTRRPSSPTPKPEIESATTEPTPKPQAETAATIQTPKPEAETAPPIQKPESTEQPQAAADTESNNDPTPKIRPAPPSFTNQPSHSKPDEPSDRQGFWDKVSTLLRKPRK